MTLLFQFDKLENLLRRLHDLRVTEKTLSSNLINTGELCKSITDCINTLTLCLSICAAEINFGWRHLKNANILQGSDVCVLRGILFRVSSEMSTMHQTQKETDHKLKYGIELAGERLQGINLISETLRENKDTKIEEIKALDDEILLLLQKRSHTMINIRDLENKIKECNDTRTKTAYLTVFASSVLVGVATVTGG